ncbi:MAG TPA: hypothetical protein VH397_04995 [Xanthobacteraceae bacterium]
MLERRHYELLAKYDSAKDIAFDADELALVCSLLNLKLSTFTKSRLEEYRKRIVRTIHEQNRVMTVLGGQYLIRSDQGREIEAYRYVVENIAKVTSPFMLDGLVGRIASHPDGPFRPRRNQRSKSRRQ